MGKKMKFNKQQNRDIEIIEDVTDLIVTPEKIEEAVEEVSEVVEVATEELVEEEVKFIHLARYYTLKLDASDYEKASLMEWLFFIDDSYRKTIHSTEGDILQQVLGLQDFNIGFQNGDDLDWTRKNLILTEK
jgi:hypothetical protein